MRLSRIVPVLAAGALLVASTSPVHAQSADPVEGVGTTTGSLTLLGLDAGDLLTLDLLSDAGIANIDEAQGARSAAAQIAALAVSVAGQSPISVPLFSVESTGEPAEAGQDLQLPPNPVLSGSALPLSLSALVGDDGARSALSAGLADLQVLSGILGLQGTDLDLGSSALTGDATATRGVVVDALTVLDLEALLGTLGLSLTDLPLDDLLALLDGLGLLEALQPLLAPLGLDPANLDLDGVLDVVFDAVDQLDDLVDGIGVLETLETSLTSTTGPVCELTGGADDLLVGLLGGGTLICDTTDTVAEQLTTVRTSIEDLSAQLDALLAQLRALLTGTGGVLDLLSGATLLDVAGLDIGVVTKATDDLETSVAEVTASLGSLQVGDLALPALDLTGPLAQVEGVLGQVTDAVNGILGQIGGGQLSDLVNVTTMQQATSVEQVGDHNVASAEFTGLLVEVAPVLDLLDGLLASLAATDSVGDLLGDLGLPVPTSGATQVLQLNALLAPVTGGLPLLAALDDGLTMQVASISQQSSFTAAAAVPGAPGAPGQTPGQAPTLPRTGSDDGLLLALAGIAVLAALGGRHLLRRSEV
jgi:LPXTG-motif cell wall-anchored protein